MTFPPQTDGQTMVFNKIIVHILCTYNSKHPRTRDEILPYVQQSYVTKLSTTQQATAPFRSGWVFSHYAPFLWLYHLQATKEDLAHI